MTGTVMITTGGTGGHVFPGLAVAARLIAKGWRVFWLGTREGLEAKLVPQHGLDFEAIHFVGVRGKGFRRLLFGPLALLPVDSRPIVTHQAGEKHIEALRATYLAAGVDAECVPFIVDMARRYAEADLVICRSGGLTVAELAAVGVGAVLV